MHASDTGAAESEGNTGTSMLDFSILYNFYPWTGAMRPQCQVYAYPVWTCALQHTVLNTVEQVPVARNGIKS